MRFRPIAVFLFAAGCHLTIACHPGPENKPVNVVLISIDTLRADHLGTYGYPLPTSRHLDTLAEESMVFERCLAPVPVTLPSHTSMLTGMYPPRHSVRDNGTFTVPTEIPTLATVLSEAGYSTFGVIGAFPMHSRFGLSRGFDVWDEDLQKQNSENLNIFFDERPASEVARRAIALLENEATEPFFLFVHFFDVHHPWNPPPPFDAINRDLAYDGEIATVDAAIGRILNKLRQESHIDDTLVIVTSDHGEGLNDHEEFSHSILLYEGTTHVPLIMRLPGATQTGRFNHTVSLVDIMPTILDVLGINAPVPMDGLSLFEEPEPDRLVYMESLSGRLGHGWNDIRASVVEHEKFILSAQREFYDLTQDPHERRNLAPQRTDDVSAAEIRLRATIDDLSQRAGPLTLESRFQVADAELRERLRVLGYLSVEGPVEDLRELADLEPGRDPRQNISAINTMNTAASRINSGDLGGAFQVIEAGLKADPSDTELLRYLIIAHFTSKNYEAALAVFPRLGPRLDREHDLIKLRALVLWRLGDLEGALADTEKAFELSPETRNLLPLAELLHANGRSERALEMLEQQNAREPCSRDLSLLTARIARAVGRHDQTREIYEILLECDPRDISARYNLGNFYLQSGDAETAEYQYQKALNIDAEYYPAIYGLSSIALQRNELENAKKLLQRVLELAPINGPYSAQSVAVLEELS